MKRVPSWSKVPYDRTHGRGSSIRAPATATAGPGRCCALSAGRQSQARDGIGVDARDPQAAAVGGDREWPVVDRVLLDDLPRARVDRDDAVALAVGDVEPLAVGRDVTGLAADVDRAGGLVVVAGDPPGLAVPCRRDPDVAVDDRDRARV